MSPHTLLLLTSGHLSREFGPQASYFHISELGGWMYQLVNCLPTKQESTAEVSQICETFGQKQAKNAVYGGFVAQNWHLQFPFKVGQQKCLLANLLRQ